MYKTAQEFLEAERKSVTLMGMSGIGKTYLAGILQTAGWFHYSADYRIGTAYLGDHILDNLRRQVSSIPFVKDLLDSGTIDFKNNVTIDNLKPISTFLGTLGNPEKGGQQKDEFRHRQNLYRDAEIQAMLDVPEFMARSQGQHFLNDSTGSLCELDRPDVLQALQKRTLILYLKASPEDEKRLFERAVSYPKPLFYPESFFETQLALYMEERSLDYIALIDPDDFYCWMFPRLFYARLPKYQAIADQYGYEMSSDALKSVRTERDFINLVANAIERKKPCL